MNWYLTKLIFSIDADYENKNCQFDEQLRLVSAVDEPEAYLKAKHLGNNLQTKIFTENNEAVFWNFVDVSEVIAVEEIKDGVQVYSSTYETYDKEIFINSVRQKGLAIQTKSTALY